MQPDMLQWLASLGVGGVLAGMMFHFYRQDGKNCAAQREAMEKDSRARHEARDKEFLAYAKDFKVIVQENTKAIQAHTSYLEELQRQRTLEGDKITSHGRRITALEDIADGLSPLGDKAK